MHLRSRNQRENSKDSVLFRVRAMRPPARAERDWAGPHDQPDSPRLNEAKKLVAIG